MTIARDNIDALTGLRFVAAFTIVLGHSYQSWLEVAGIGMPLFFTLSGFIIHYVYNSSFGGRWRQAGAEFAIARISRIYPLYLALLLYMLLRSPMGQELATPANFPALLAYLIGCWTWWPFVVNGHTLIDYYYHISWSVSTELFFYVCYAFFLYRFQKIQKISHCFMALLGFCIASYLLFYSLFATRDAWEALVLALFPQFPARADNFTESLYRWLLYISPYARVFEFIGGVLTCQLFLLVRRQPELRARLWPGGMAWLAIVVIAALFAAFFYHGMRNPWLAVGNQSPAAFLVSLHMNFLLAPGCYLLIFSLALGGSVVSRALSSVVPRFLGDVSYSTYLSHPMADRVLFHARIEVTATLPHLLAIMVVVYAMSWLLYTTIEVPAKRVLRQLLQPRLVGPPSLLRRA